MGGALKNVLAIATGIMDGLNYGSNARAALITRGGWWPSCGLLLPPWSISHLHLRPPTHPRPPCGPNTHCTPQHGGPKGAATACPGPTCYCLPWPHLLLPHLGTTCYYPTLVPPAACPAPDPTHCSHLPPPTGLYEITKVTVAKGGHPLTMGESCWTMGESCWTMGESCWSSLIVSVVCYVLAHAPPAAAVASYCPASYQRCLGAAGGLAGMGDVILTCTGELSRNRTVGLRLGRGEKLADIQVGQGAMACSVCAALCAREPRVPCVVAVHACRPARPLWPRGCPPAKLPSS